MKVNALAKIGTTVSKVAGRTGLVLRKKSPEILLAAGVVGFVGTVVLACKATLKADEILDEHEKKTKDIEEAMSIAEKYPDEYDYDKEVYERDLAILKLKTVGKFVRLYAPAIAVGSVSIACLITSRNILNKRYLAVVSAYNALSEVFQTYRKRVVDEYGEKLDKHFRYGTVYGSHDETGVDEKGKPVKKTVDTEETTIKLPSDTAVFFDEANHNWDRNPNFSLMFLRAQQNMLNDLLHTRGHVFLNEVYDALGFPHTQTGSVVGWIEGDGNSNYIDFGLYKDHEKNVRRFVNGRENSILLDFNHDGVIWDKI